MKPSHEDIAAVQGTYEKVVSALPFDADAIVLDGGLTKHLCGLLDTGHAFLADHVLSVNEHIINAIQAFLQKSTQGRELTQTVCHEFARYMAANLLYLVVEEAAMETLKENLPVLDDEDKEEDDDFYEESDDEEEDDNEV